MKSYEKPTDEQVDACLPLLSSPQHAEYFFSRLENPRWVAMLEKRKVFAYPPECVPVEGGGIRFPHWPASKYLARMASLVPDDVVRILGTIRTDNPSILNDLVSAALAMPIANAETLVPAICNAAKSGLFFLSFKEASDLCINFANANLLDASMKLARSLFTPRASNDTQRDDYWYKDGLEKVAPVLLSKQTKPFLQCLCTWLATFVIERKDVKPGTSEDQSYLWRPAIEEHSQNRSHDFVSDIVDIVAKSFLNSILNNHISMSDAYSILEKYSFNIFNRIWIHLADRGSVVEPDACRDAIMNEEYFSNYCFKHEYAMLVKNNFQILDQEKQAEWLSWVNKHHDSEVSAHSDYWRYERLHCIKAHLRGQELAFYQKMLAVHGEPQLADLVVKMSSRWGHESPITVEELASMSFEQAVEKVCSWKFNEKQFSGPDLEGLAGTFGTYVASQVVAFSANAELLIGRPSIFTRKFVQIMTDAVKSGKEVHIESIIELSKRVLSQPVSTRTTPVCPRDSLVDKDWQWTRDAISDFLEEVLKATDKNDKYVFTLEKCRQLIWPLLEVLNRDPAESSIIHDFSGEDPRYHDYIDLAINSSRGKALESVLEYARWVSNQIKKNDGGQDLVPNGFGSIPEVRDALEWHLGAGNRSIEALAILGSRVSLLYWIDKEWLASNAGKIFNLEGVHATPAETSGWAAWNAFLVWVNPHIEFYKTFRTQFEFSMQQSIDVSVSERRRENPMIRMSEHLMLLYGRGQLESDADKALLQFLLTSSDSKIRMHAIGFLGQSAQEENIPQEIIVRIMKMWEEYWNGKGKSDAKEHRESYLFGAWFSSRGFPPAWALDCLRQFVEFNPTPSPDHLVMDQLALIAETDLLKTIQIVDIMAHGDMEGWRVSGWSEPMTKILTLAMHSEDASVREIATGLIHYLGRRGFIHYGKLLKD